MPNQGDAVNRHASGLRAHHQRRRRDHQPNGSHAHALGADPHELHGRARQRQADAADRRHHEADGARRPRHAVLADGLDAHGARHDDGRRLGGQVDAKGEGLDRHGRVRRIGVVDAEDRHGDAVACMLARAAGGNGRRRCGIEGQQSASVAAGVAVEADAFDGPVKAGDERREAVVPIVKLLCGAGKTVQEGDSQRANVSVLASKK